MTRYQPPLSFEGGQAYTHNGDWDLMESLGLKTSFGRDWTDVGTVDLYEDGGTTIKVEVCAMPAQFFRFTITRPREDDGKPETLVVDTGSGGFGEYWAAAKLIARKMLDIERVEA